MSQDVNAAERRETFLALVRDRMVPALNGEDYLLCFNAVRAERPELLANFDPDQARDENGQWTTEEGFSTAPLGKKTTLASEVVWKDDDGKERHGQLGFHEEHTIRSGSEIRSEKTGKTHVREVRVEHVDDPKIPGRKLRRLVPVDPGEAGEDILDKKRTILVPTAKLRQIGKAGFNAPDHK